MSHDPRTRAYTERRTTEGLSKKEIMRCLKRYIANEIHRALTTADQHQQHTPPHNTPPPLDIGASGSPGPPSVGAGTGRCLGPVMLAAAGW
jgi:hypothetical protein